MGGEGPPLLRGRIEAPACLDGSLPDRWFLVARDAFNGVLLWKRPIRHWGWRAWSVQWRGRFNIPPHLPKRLVAAGGKVLVASIDEHRVVALSATDGKPLWSFTAGARVSTPPTLHGGLALVGSADGWVYCLRAEDGQLVWRRRIAPRDRLVGAFGQLESAWPVHGSVLVQNDVAYVAAGRSSYLDGGIFLKALDPATGKVLDHHVPYSPDPAMGDMPPGDARTIPGAKADILVGDGSAVFTRQQRVFGDDSGRGSHLFSTAGFRDASWFNRTRWAIGAAGYAELLVFDDQIAYGVAAYPGRNRAHVFQPVGEGYVLFARSWKTRASRDRASGGPRRPEPLWSERVPVRITALALAGKTLVAAGSPDAIDPRDPLAFLEGRRTGKLWLSSAEDGNKLAEYDLPSPPRSSTAWRPPAGGSSSARPVATSFALPGTESRHCFGRRQTTPDATHGGVTQRIGDLGAAVGRNRAVRVRAIRITTQRIREPRGHRCIYGERFFTSGSGRPGTALCLASKGAQTGSGA